MQAQVPQNLRVRGWGSACRTASLILMYISLIIVGKEHRHTSGVCAESGEACAGLASPQKGRKGEGTGTGHIWVVAAWAGGPMPGAAGQVA